MTFATVIRVLAAVFALTAGGTPSFAADITGAGATFPYPVYAAWAEAYKKETGVNITYQAVGSASGIKQIKTRSVMFAASDIPLAADDLEQAGLTQFPIVFGGVVPVINVEGIKPGQFILDGATLAGIFSGAITVWNAPKIAALNPTLSLPAKRIVPIARSDGSGTNFIFTSYLSGVSVAFKEKVGAGALVPWPGFMTARGNEGVAEKAAKTDGAIAYVEFVYAKEHDMNYVSMRTKFGNIITPSIGAFRGATRDTTAPDLSWPIFGASYVLLQKKAHDTLSSQQTLQFFAWVFHKGGAIAEQLYYVPLPAPAAETIEAAWTQTVRNADGTALWPIAQNAAR